MRVRRDGDSVGLSINHAEAIVLLYVCERVTRALAADPDDGANRRLLPDPYPEDAEAAEEFARYSREETIQLKAADVRAVEDAVRVVTGSEASRARRSSTIWIESDGLGSWLRALTSARLVLASELGIFAEGSDDPEPDTDLRELNEIFEWLGYLQESLLD